VYYRCNLIQACWPSFGASLFLVFQFSIQKYKYLKNRSRILTFVLHRCETWSLTLRNIDFGCSSIGCWERHFALTGNRLTEEWRRLHNEELYDLHSSPNMGVIKSRRMRWVGHVAYTEETKGTYRVFWEPWGKETTCKTCA
jgi:hypothetical protein